MEEKNTLQELEAGFINHTPKEIAKAFLVLDQEKALDVADYIEGLYYIGEINPNQKLIDFEQDTEIILWEKLNLELGINNINE